ncbi:MAG: hypothetical protein ACREFW_09605, partial [Rhizomicrobium sp.]
GKYRVALLADAGSSEDVEVLAFRKPPEELPPAASNQIPAVAAGLPPAAPMPQAAPAPLAAPLGPKGASVHAGRPPAANPRAAGSTVAGRPSGAPAAAAPAQAAATSPPAPDTSETSAGETDRDR